MCFVAVDMLAQDLDETFGDQADFDQDNNTINTNSASFEFGSGLNFSFEDNQYQFKIGGFIQPSFAYSKLSGMDAENEFNARRTYFNISGRALKQKVSFFIQNDFSDTDALLDAWVAYHPTEQLTITVGQRRVNFNNKEMTFDEDKFQFTERGLLSTSLSSSGREFGVFVDAKYNVGNMGVEPSVGITSGDGRNSFGVDSRDVDAGGLKYGARLNIYPLGFFSKGNDVQTADLLHEERFKFALGAAGSYNDGASNEVGEGHNDFIIYNQEGRPQLPDYRQIYLDILMKYRGFSFLTEYANATAGELQQTFVNPAGTVALQPQQISSFLALGNAVSMQSGYVTKKGYAIDLRYTSLKPEFENFSSTVLRDTEVYTLGLTKYFKNNDLKLQTAFSSIRQDGQDLFQAELVLQIVF
jgi:hypothetical protein